MFMRAIDAFGLLEYEEKLVRKLSLRSVHMCVCMHQYICFEVFAVIGLAKFYIFRKDVSESEYDASEVTK